MNETATELKSCTSDRPDASTSDCAPQSPSEQASNDPSDGPLSRSRPRADELSSTQWDAVGRIEVDRFCEHCGYNLYTQAVVRHPELGLLLVRCPDCGHLHAAREHTTATSIWMRRLAVPATFLWVGAILFLTFMTFMGMMGMNIATFDQATRWETVRAVGGSTTVYRAGQRQLYNENFPDDTESIIIVNSFRACSGALGFAFAVFLTLSFPHWRRWGYFVAVVCIAAAPPAVIYYLLQNEVVSGQAHGMYISMMYTLPFAVLGLVGSLTGRILCRGFIRLVLPPKLRTPFTYLWTTDGKLPPTANSATAFRRDYSSTTAMQ